MGEHPKEKPKRKNTSGNRSTSIRQPRQGAQGGRDALGDRTDHPANDHSKNRRTTVWTVGHSTRPVDSFVALLRAHNIRRLIDVRTVPRSRHNPQFNQDQFPESLKAAGIEYIHLPALGGLRHARRDSINTAWRNASFRGYADYMQTPEFHAAQMELIRLAQNRRTAIMCAEAVPWRCHRSLIADALLVHGIGVEEIVSGSNTRPHVLTPWASVAGEQITYPAGS